MEQNLVEKTGKSLEQWQQLLTQQGLTKHAECMAFLKKEQGLTHGYANFITLKFRQADAASASPTDLIAAQYQGKPELHSIYQKLSAYILTLGDDIELSPKKAAVSFRRKRQFALVQPSTKKRIDLGLKLNDVEPQGRLENSGPFGAMCTHRIQLTSEKDVDQRVLDWINLAYEQAG